MSGPLLPRPLPGPILHPRPVPIPRPLPIPVNRPPFVAIKPYPVRLPPLGPVSMLPQVDLRPEIQSFGLAVRDQGSRGTCSVFALTFLLEYAYDSRLNGGFSALSEEYLNYVAHLVLGTSGDGGFFDQLDNGYQAWGMATAAEEPTRRPRSAPFRSRCSTRAPFGRALRLTSSSPGTTPREHHWTNSTASSPTLTPTRPSPLAAGGRQVRRGARAPWTESR